VRFHTAKHRNRERSKRNKTNRKSRNEVNRQQEEQELQALTPEEAAARKEEAYQRRVGQHTWRGLLATSSARCPLARAIPSAPAEGPRGRIGKHADSSPLRWLAPSGPRAALCPALSLLILCCSPFPLPPFLLLSSCHRCPFANASTLSSLPPSFPSLSPRLLGRSRHTSSSRSA